MIVKQERPYSLLKAVNDSLGQLGGKNRNGTIQNGNAHIAITFEQGFQHFVDTIDQAGLGEVTNIDADSKTITIQAPPLTPPQ